MNRTGVILLAGGVGSRMQSKIPKQFLSLEQDKMVIQYSLKVFLSLPEIKEIIVVCDPQYRNLLAPYPIKFALPGQRRQDSVYQGLLSLSSNTEFVCIHDGARPFITKENVQDVIEAAKKHGAATLGMPVKVTIKECDENELVTKTLDRSKIWEIQTPQVIRYDWLKMGFEKINRDEITVTDDVSIVEHIGHPVKLIRGTDKNIKITTPEDLHLAECFLK